jgi:hypothetical protein
MVMQENVALAADNQANVVKTAQSQHVANWDYIQVNVVKIVENLARL